MSRRTSVLPEMVPVLTGSLWRSACTAPGVRRARGGPVPSGGPPVQGDPAGRTGGGAGGSPYGDLDAPDGNGIALARGFTSRVVGRSGERVGGLTWHAAPVGGGCFADGDGWIYVSNSEVPLLGGVSALRFGPDGTVRNGYRILSGTEWNRAGGATPWDTWLSCEETGRGRIFECDPYGHRAAMPRLAMGLFRHEGAAFDPARAAVYLTEGEPDGCFYRFRPEEWGDLTTGVLEVMVGGPGSGPVGWRRVPNPAALFEPTREQVEGAKRFDGSGGCHYSSGFCYFTTEGDGRVWAYDAEKERITTLRGGDAPPDEGDDAAPGLTGDLFVAECGGAMEITVITDAGMATPFLRVTGHGESEITGPAFSPDGGRLYFSSRLGGEGSPAAGITYEVTGPFRG
ncbi:DUF839 domain-containing protein [Microtetraspora sp. AC03309]|uniref:alkaline phosphatase PhoX n=1 Tax=Microtetraspora sp. AC03309 TaxID=2779376 RepID=UPI001E4875A3|nr:alkaline phosphatase PhoX [Microtetraspora sp. AC03309]MCC5578239.1 DUF839 domain-containing protein [Microtetraspora sp. AC03309]